MNNSVLRESSVQKSLTKKTFLSSCPTCMRAIKSRHVIEDGYKYVVKVCPYDNTHIKSLVEKYGKKLKGKFEKEEWCMYTAKEGQKIFKEEHVKNIQNCTGVYFLLTYKCNSKCKICFDNKNPYRKDLSLEFIKKKMKLYKNKLIYLSGGEPTVRDDLPEIIRECAKNGNQVVLFTNGLKLADKNYLKKLLDAGMSYVYFSFDGFKESTYEIARGGRHELKLKLEALKNMKEAGVRVAIQATVIKGVNDDQIGLMLDYAKSNPNVSELSLRALYLPGADADTKLTKENVPSVEEMRELVYRALNDEINDEWVETQHELIINARRLLKKLNPNLKMNPPKIGNIFLRRTKTGFEALLTKEEMKKAANHLKEVNKGRITSILGLLKPKYLRHALPFFKNKMVIQNVEREVFNNNIFRVAFGEIHTLLDSKLTGPAVSLFYFSASLIRNMESN